MAALLKKYYQVECKCGHTGSKKFYIPIKFPVKAYNGKEAAEIARKIPRCKHHHSDCILSVEEISYEDYLTLIKINKNDPYLKCHSIQEQNQYDLSDRFVIDSHFVDDRYPEECQTQFHQTFEGKTKIKNPKKYIRFNKNNYMEVSY